MDLTNYIEPEELLTTKKVLSCSVRMDRKTILEALISEVVLINGYKCKVPEHELLMCLINRRYGELELEFEIIND